MRVGILILTLVLSSVESFSLPKDANVRRRLRSAQDFSLQSNLFVEYGNLLKSNNAIPTKMITSGLIAAIGDVIQQVFIKEQASRKFDFRRLLVFMLVNIFYIGPVSHFWFKLLESITSQLTSKLSKATVQVVVDQTLGAFFITGGFLATFEVIDRVVPSGVSDDEDTKRKDSVLTNVYNACNAKLMRTMISTWYNNKLFEHINIQT